MNALKMTLDLAQKDLDQLKTADSNFKKHLLCQRLIEALTAVQDSLEAEEQGESEEF